MIALVVTIIVLLILAAVTINLTIGENGIFKRAQDAVDRYEIAALEEKLEMYDATSIIDSISGNSSSIDFIKGVYSFEIISNESGKENILDCVIYLDGQLYRAKIKWTNEEIKIESAKKINELENISIPIYITLFNNDLIGKIEVLGEENDAVIIRYEEKKYVVKRDKQDENVKISIDYFYGIFDEEPGILEGNGTKENPFKIQSIEDLVAFSENEHYEYYDSYISLKEDLDFNSDESYINPNTTDFGDINENDVIEPLKTELTTGTGFKPIASKSMFVGTFEGNNHAIKNLYMNKGNYENQGLFAEVTSSQIRNLKVTGNIISMAENVGGIVGNLQDMVIIENCISEVNITALGGINVGGILGGDSSASCSIQNCKNYGTITVAEKTETVEEIAIGGIVGQKNGGRLENSINYGAINTISDGANLYKGEIYGKNFASDEIFVNCENNGAIEVKTISAQGPFTTCVGGIIGIMYKGDR